MTGNRSGTSLRGLNARFFEPLSMWTMIFGIVCLCQPWVLVAHRYGLIIIIIGLIAFIITSHIGPPAEPEQEGQ
jgi:hypothetical protein